MIIKKDGEKFIVYNKTKLQKEVKVDGTEIDMPTKEFEGNKEMLEMEINQMTDNIAREQIELDAKKAVLAAINNSIK